MVEGVLVNLLVQTNAENVMVDETTTLTAKLAEMMADIAALPTQSMITASIAALRTELMGDGVPEAYDTFKERFFPSRPAKMSDSSLSPPNSQKTTVLMSGTSPVLNHRGL